MTSIIVNRHTRANGSAPPPKSKPNGHDRAVTPAQQHALALASLGHRVVPHTTLEVPETANKPAQRRHPYMKDWGEAATTDPHVINSWAALFNRAGGVGILVGDDDTLGIEIDEPGHEALTAVCKAIPGEGAVVLSGGGGWHCYFRHTAYSRAKLLPLGSPNLPGKKRTKSIELYTTPHPFLAPGTRHWKTGKVYQWRNPNCVEATAIPDALVDALVQLPWRPTGSDRTARADFIARDAVLLKPEVDVVELMRGVGLQRIKGGKFAASKVQPCPFSDSNHDSSSTWVFFYRHAQHSLRFFCYSCKDGDTREMLQKLGVDVDAVSLPSVAAAQQQGLILTSLPLAMAVPRSEQALMTRGTGRDGIFRRGENLVRVVRHRDTEEFKRNGDGQDRRDPNLNLIRAMTPVSVRYELSKTGLIYRETKSGLQADDAEFDWVQTIVDNVAQQGEASPWPYLRGVMRTPLLLEDGTVVQEPGYHKPTGIWLDIDPTLFPKIPKRVSKREALNALHTFDTVYERFPFVDNDGEPVVAEQVNKDWHKTPGGAVILSAVLSIVARNLLPVVPAVALDAPTQRTGKTKLAEAAVGAATGLSLDPTDYKNAEEFAKGLLPLLREGLQAVLVDNVTKYFSSDQLSIAITTAGEPKLRRLHENDMERVRNYTVFFVTGNNLTFTGDMARGRVVKCSIDARMEHPEFRNFNNVPDPPVYARQHFPELAVAALTMLLGYIQADKPWQKEVAHAGTFYDWSRLVRGCLLWLGCADPWTTTINVSEDDPYHDQDVALLEKWFKFLKQEPHTLESLRHKFVESPGTLTGKRSLFAELFGDERDVTEGRVGVRLNRLKRRVTGDYRLKAVPHKGRSNEWKVIYMGNDKQLKKAMDKTADLGVSAVAPSSPKVTVKAKKPTKY